MSDNEVAMVEAREAIVVANAAVEAALGAVLEGDRKGLVLSREVEVALAAKFFADSLDLEDVVVVAAVAVMRLAGRRFEG